MKRPLTIFICLLWLTPALAQSPFAPPKPKEPPKSETFVAPQVTIPQPPRQKPLGVVNGKKMCLDLQTGQIMDCIADPNDPTTTSQALLLPAPPGAPVTAPTKSGRNPATPVTLPTIPTAPPAQPAPDLQKIKAEAKAEAKAEVLASVKTEALKEAQKDLNAKLGDFEKKIAEANTRVQAAEAKASALTKQIDSKNQEYQAQKAQIESLQKDLQHLREEKAKTPAHEQAPHPTPAPAQLEKKHAPKPEKKAEAAADPLQPPSSLIKATPQLPPAPEKAPEKPKAPKPEPVPPTLQAPAKAHGEPISTVPAPASTPETKPKPDPNPQPANAALESIINAPATPQPEQPKPQAPASPAPQPSPPTSTIEVKEISSPKEKVSPALTPQTQGKLAPSSLEQRAKKDLPLLPSADARVSAAFADQHPEAPTQPSLAIGQTVDVAPSVKRGSKARTGKGKKVTIYEYSTHESVCPDALAYRIGQESWNWICADKVRVLSQATPIPHYETQQ